MLKFKTTLSSIKKPLISESRKICIFLNGLAHCFGQKLEFFLLFFFEKI